MSEDGVRRRQSIVQDRVLLVLCLCGSLALALAGFIDTAPNRLARAAALSLWQGPLPAAAAVCLALVILTSAAFVTRARALLTLFAAALLLLVCLFAAGAFATALASPDAPAARQSLGFAFWALIAVALFAMQQALQDAATLLVTRLITPLLVGLAIALIVLSGQLDSLSLMQEFATHRSVFAGELLRHIALVRAALFFALLIGVPLTFVILRHAALRTAVFTTLNILQTIPSIAIFGLLIAPLSALVERVPLLGQIGIGGTGTTPAVIALTLYALLPLVRNFSTGIAEVPEGVKDAARGLGFDARQSLVSVELPLALPALVSGLRIVTVQSIGLAAVAALIGAGGLGTFVFQGIGQYALDLVLVGALPIIFLALVADLGFRLLQAAIGRPA